MAPAEPAADPRDGQEGVALRVSLIVPTYNGAHLMPVCLDAIAAQSRRPDETVVVDDASTDDTAGLLAARYPWVRVVRLETNRGFAGAVNVGIRATRGEVAVLLNND